jgi:hypothetical protein
MDANTEVTIHLPVLIVPEDCAESCRKLRSAKDDATLKAVERPDTQMVVVCSNHQRFSCNAHIFDAGMWMYTGDGAGTKRYYGNPAIIENSSGRGTVSQRIKAAKDKGNAQEYKELPTI